MGTGPHRKRWRRTVSAGGLSLALGLALAGCETLGYYAQSIDGHLRLMNGRESIDELAGEEDTPEVLRDRLRLVAEIRDFASRDLLLPENGSYRSYVDIGRSHVVWSVVAAPELSLEPKTWCFPFAGCVSYRGYFAHDKARAFGDRLADQGYDVYVGGVAAYSTLGWFDDPLPSSVIRWPEYDLAGLIFHELAHQVVYVTDDSGFNEAFAVTVEREGVRRWLAARGSSDLLEAYSRSERLQDEFLRLVFATRERLETVYGSDLPEAEKRREKTQIFADMRARYEPLKDEWAGDARYDRWFADGLNNARMASVVTYHDLAAGFAAMLARHDGDLAGFYAEVDALAEQPRQARRERLKSLARIARRPSTAVPPGGAFKAFRSARVLNVVSATPPRPTCRTPRRQGHLPRLATACGEKCWLVRSPPVTGG